jgi:hypothetical protein
MAWITGSFLGRRGKPKIRMGSVDSRKLPRERRRPKTRTGSVDPRKLPRDRQHTDSFFIDSN